MYIIDPSFCWPFLEYDVEEIEFIDVYYTEFRKKNSGIVAYNETSQIDLNEILIAKDRTRYLNYRVSSARLSKRGPAVYTYLRDDSKMEFGESGRDAIKYTMTQGLFKKDYDLKHVILEFKSH